MIIYYFNFYFLLFLIYKDIILIFLFSTRLVNGFKSDKLLNPIIDPPDQNPASAPELYSIGFKLISAFSRDNKYHILKCDSIEGDLVLIFSKAAVFSN
jgi:hypothetical protein